MIMVMAALWAFIPTDGIALITQWFFHKVVHVSLFYKFKMSEVNLHKVIYIFFYIIKMLNRVRVMVMVFNATFNNISVLSWRSDLLVAETGVPGENHRPVTNN